MLLALLLRADSVAPRYYCWQFATLWRFHPIKLLVGFRTLILGGDSVTGGRPDRVKEVLALLESVTAKDAPTRLTYADICKKAGIKETSFRAFRKGVHPNQIPIREHTQIETARKIKEAIAKLQKSRVDAPIAYMATKELLGISASDLAVWLERHRGLYLSYRHASSEQLIQVSRLEIDGDESSTRYRHVQRITSPRFGEGNERVIKGHVYPFKKCSHFVDCTKGSMRHMIMSDIVSLDVFEYLVGVLVALSTDQKYPFAARVIAVKVGNDPRGELPTNPQALGISFPNDEEARRAITPDVWTFVELPTIGRVLNATDEPGVLRAEVFHQPRRQDS